MKAWIVPKGCLKLDELRIEDARHPRPAPHRSSRACGPPHSATAISSLSPAVTSAAQRSATPCRCPTAPAKSWRRDLKSRASRSGIESRQHIFPELGRRTASAGCAPGDRRAAGRRTGRVRALRSARCSRDAREPFFRGRRDLELRRRSPPGTPS